MNVINVALHVHVHACVYTCSNLGFGISAVKTSHYSLKIAKSLSHSQGVDAIFELCQFSMGIQDNRLQ